MCDEKKKSFWYHGCEGEWKRCPFCYQNVCYYHGCTNHEGVKGGHSDCSTYCNTAAITSHMCEGHMSSCSGCGLVYCNYHSQQVGLGCLKGGHICSVSCDTSPAYRSNCRGNIAKCSDCSFKYCEYHFEAVASVLTPTGGHVCTTTAGSNLVYNIAELFHEPLIAAVQDAEESVYTLALLSRNVYNLTDGNYSQLDEDLDDYECIPDSIMNVSGSCGMAVWRNKSNDIRILSIKGTDANRITDVALDVDFSGIVDMILGHRSPSGGYLVMDTLRLAKELFVKYSCSMITGHSLGGYVAEIFATHNNIPGIGFCSPGVNGPVVRLGGRETKGFQNVNWEHDKIGNVAAGLYAHVQWSVYVNYDGFQQHGIAPMTTFWKEKRDSGEANITNQNILNHCESKRTGYYIS